MRSAIPKLVDASDGVNVKLDKCGDIQEALRMIYVAKSLGVKTMLAAGSPVPLRIFRRWSTTRIWTEIG